MTILQIRRAVSVAKHMMVSLDFEFHLASGNFLVIVPIQLLRWKGIAWKNNVQLLFATFFHTSRFPVTFISRLMRDCQVNAIKSYTHAQGRSIAFFTWKFQNLLVTSLSQCYVNVSQVLRFYLFTLIWT